MQQEVPLQIIWKYEHLVRIFIAITRILKLIQCLRCAVSNVVSAVRPGGGGGLWGWKWGKVVPSSGG